MDNFLIPYFSIIFSIVFYPPAMVYFALVAGLGIYTWLAFAAMLSPYTVLWYYVASHRDEIYVKSISRPTKWDISETLDEYEETLKEK